MPSRLGKRKDYNLVDDAYDSRVPLHNEDAFRHGINFKAKYIGTLDVPRPTGRMEIVVAMRRIRYEFKAKSIKKRKVNIRVSTDGVRVVLRKKKKKKEWAWDLDRMLVMQDPIYRIFYVSHDSHDLKIWSYIARDGASNVFRCNVFKSPKKSLAMHIVRTVGQAFEVCHKLNIGPPPKKDEKPAVKEKEKIEESDDKAGGETGDSKEDDKVQEVTPVESATSNGDIDAKLAKSLSSEGNPPVAANDLLLLQSASEPISIQAIDSKTPLSIHHQLQLSQQKIQQAEQQTEVAVAQVHLLKDQLAAETTARIEAQARNHQLLVQNRELLQQLSELVAKLAEVEAKLNNSVSDHQLSVILGNVVIDPTTPATAGIQGAVLPGTDLTKVSPFVDTSLFENTNAGNVPSPDLSKLSNGLRVTGVDTSTSTITKSSMGSGSVRAKSRRKANGEGSGSSSDSSSDEEEGLSPAIRLASETGTVKNPSLHANPISLGNGVPVGDQTVDTSIWTSGLATPERILSGQGYQQPAANFDGSSLTTTLNDSSLSNGYTLSPIFTVGTNEPQSSFQHFSVTEADDSLRIGDTPKSGIKKTITKSFSTSIDMHAQGRSAPATSHSSGDLLQNNNSGLMTLSPDMSMRMDGWDKSVQGELRESMDKSSELNATPRLNPPPSRVKRAPSSRSQPEYRPRPDTHSSDNSTSPPTVPVKVTQEHVTSPKLIDTSDSDVEIPTKLRKYNQRMKLSQSSYSYGSDPLLSHLDPLLSKSKSFDNPSPALVKKGPEQTTATALSPVQDIGQSNPFLYITPQTPESSKYCKPIDADELSKSYSDLQQPTTLYASGVFTSPQEYESKLRYEPLRKQQASEWYPAASGVTESRLNSSFHAGDKKKEVTFAGQIKLQEGGRDPLPAYRTYSDLPSTVTPLKKNSATVSHVTVGSQLISSLNSNNSNNLGKKEPLVCTKSSELKDVIPDDKSKSKGLFAEPPSIDGNVSLLDDLFISETERDSGRKSQSLPLLSSNASFAEISNGKKSLIEEVSLLDDIMEMMNGEDGSTINAKDASVTRKGTQLGVTAGSSTSGHDASNSTMSESGRVTPTSELHPISVGSNSDSGVSGCGGGAKHDHTIFGAL